MNTDHQHVAAWFKAWRKHLRGWLINRCRVSPCDADDIVQDVFERVMLYQSHQSVENPKSYLTKVAMNVLCESLERARNKKPHDSADLEFLIAPESQECYSIVQQESAKRIIDGIIGQMPVRRQKILMMHTDGGYTYKQVAKHTGVTYRIVLRELTRAYTHIRGSIPSSENFL